MCFFAVNPFLGPGNHWFASVTIVLPFLKFHINRPPIDFPGGSDGKESACNAGDLGSLCWEDPLGKEMASHSNSLVWEIPWTEEPGGAIHYIGSQRVGHD